MNTGVHVESRSVVTATALKVAEKFKRPVEQRTYNTPIEPESPTLFDRDILVKIDAKMQPHYALKGLSTGNLTFLATRLRHWAVNRTISPQKIGDATVPLTVLAEGPSCPILLEFGNRLLYCAEVNTGKTQGAFKRIVGNFTKYHMERLVNSSSGYISKSIMRYVLEQRYLVKGNDRPCDPISAAFIESQGTVK